MRYTQSLHNLHPFRLRNVIISEEGWGLFPVLNKQQNMEYEPSARYFHAAISMGHTMLVLAGRGSRSSVDSSVVERFNTTSTTWTQPHRLLNQALPDGYRLMGVTSDGEKLYTFGGFVGRQRCNTLYEIDLFTLEC